MIGVCAVVLAVVLGWVAGTWIGPGAGVLFSLASLVPPAVWVAATERRQRVNAEEKERQEILREFAPPAPMADDDDEQAMPGQAAGRAVARYLRPEEAVVPFRDSRELAELLAWCIAGGHVGVRLLTGEGGAGKTRLALRLGQDLEAAGWLPLWVPRGAENRAARAVRTVGQPCVLVVDYAETRSNLVGLVGDIADDRDGPEVRVVLLARSAGEWWQQLLGGSEERAAALLEAHAPVGARAAEGGGRPTRNFHRGLGRVRGEAGDGPAGCPADVV